MTRLSSSDLRGALSFAALLGEASDLDAFVGVTLEGLPGLVSAEIVSYNEMNAEAARASSSPMSGRASSAATSNAV